MPKGVRGKGIAEFDSRDVKHAMFRLAHFDPTCRDEYGNQVVDYLVLDSLATYGLLPVTAMEIKQTIKSSFRLDFEEPEIDSAGKRLHHKGLIEYEERERFERPRFQILPETQQRIASNLASIQKLEDEVMETWKADLSVKYHGYPAVTDNLEQIVENLQLFTTRILLRHGAECVALLYPEAQKTRQWLESVGGSIIEVLPKLDPFVDAVGALEIPSFFKNCDSKRKAYVTSLFNSSFFWHLVQVDDKCSRLLREVTKGQRLYLDTTILYSLVGLDGATMLQSVHTMLKLARELGYELWATTKSVDEFHSSLDWKMKELRLRPPLPSELAKIAVEALEEDSFLVSYLTDFVEHGTSIEEFVAEKSHLEAILQGLNITTTNTFRQQIEESQEQLYEEGVLRSVCKVGVGEHIIQHDAFHRIFITKMRQGPKYHFPEAVAWFLTHDSKLPEYDRVARKGKPQLPFCITSDQWVQINRPLLARTANQEEYEESFHVLVTQPFLRTMMGTLSLERAYTEVLGRLARYKNMNPQLALSIVTDKHFMVSMASETAQEDAEDRIESKLVDIAEQLRSEKDALARKLKTTEAEIQKSSQQIVHVQGLVEATEEALEKERNERQAAEKQAQTIQRESDQKLADLQQEFLNYKKRTQEDSLKKSAYLRLAVVLIGVAALEMAAALLAVNLGAGDNTFQRLANHWEVFVLLGPGVTVLAGWFFIGKERIRALGWAFRKILREE